MQYKYLFGPVPSRRLGISLGIDLVPHKICTMDCVYCECGPTTNLTLKRAEYVPTHQVLREVDHFLAQNPQPEYLTFSGSGEPTLHSGIGRIARHLKQNHKAPLALLTNATLMDQPDVRKELLDIDILLPSLDSARVETFRKINRPHPELELDRIIDGLVEFRKEFAGQIWLEIFILPPLNTEHREMECLQDALNRIRPDRVQLNTLDRPGSEEWVKKASPALLEEISERLRHPRLEIISRYRRRKDIRSYRKDAESAIMETISRRPCTLEDLVAILGMHRNELNKYLDVLENEKRIRPEIQDRGIFYRTVRNRTPSNSD